MKSFATTSPMVVIAAAAPVGCAPDPTISADHARIADFAAYPSLGFAKHSFKAGA